jgi:hypothetical protein
VYDVDEVGCHMPRSTVSIAVPEDLARELPPDPVERREVLVLGLREWKVRKALEAYGRGEGSLAYAAQQAGVSLREMIPLAYAHGLTPRAETTESNDLAL